MRRDQAEKTVLGFFDKRKIFDGEVPFPAGTDSIDKKKMGVILEEYRDKLFPFHKLQDFLPLSDLSEEDVRKLMECTGRI